MVYLKGDDLYVDPNYDKPYYEWIRMPVLKIQRKTEIDADVIDAATQRVLNDKLFQDLVARLKAMLMKQKGKIDSFQVRSDAPQADWDQAFALAIYQYDIAEAFDSSAETIYYRRPLVVWDMSKSNKSINKI